MLSRVIRAPLIGLIILGLIIGFTFSAALAGTEDATPNEVSFSLTDASAYIAGTTDNPANEVATVSFRAAFDAAQAGYLQEATIKLQFDPDYVTLDAAREDGDWGTVTPSLTIIPGNPTTVVYILDPDPGTSTIEISTSPVALAEFDFVIACQETPPTVPITIEYGAGETTVNDGVDLHYVTESQRTDDGVVQAYSYSWGAMVIDGQGQIEMEGILGQDILVPLNLGSTFKVASVDMTISYDNTELQYLGVQDLHATFTGSTVTFPTTGQIRIELATDEATEPRVEFSAETMVKVKFRVINDWQGSNTAISYVGLPVLEMALGSGTCGANSTGTGGTSGGVITIPAYTAQYTADWTEGGVLSAVDDLASLQLKMTNNFPAGGAADAIITNMKLAPGLQAVSEDPGADWGLHTYPTATGQDVSLRLETTSFWDLSSTAQNLVDFNIETASSFTPPTAYDSRYYTVAFQTPYNNTAIYDAVVSDTTDQVDLENPAGGLTWVSPDPIEYLMGEFYCPYRSQGSGVIYQDIFARSAFDLHDFRIKVTVTGDHHIYDVDPELGVSVESFDQTSYKWVILATNLMWSDQTATDTRTKIATFSYAYSGSSNLVQAKVGGGVPDVPDIQATSGGGGYYVTHTSTVSFEDPDPGDFYMMDPSDNEHHYVGVGNTIRNRWWVDIFVDPDPERPMDLNGLHGLPVAYQLFQNYPNPFNPTTEIVYGLPEGGSVELAVYNIAGQKVATLVDSWQDAGYYRYEMDGSDLSSGIYFYRLTTGTYSESKKMVLLK